jgi:sterol desaturase/sphingolipid hydroxylase (fatty acid hydroxylase superfamily)
MHKTRDREAVFIHETIILFALLGWFILLAIAEVVSGRNRVREDVNDRRLITNFGLAIAVLIVSSVFPLAKLAASGIGQKFGTGLTGWVALPWLAIVLLALLAESLIVYWSHRLMHRLPLLWRIHRVHHADNGFDVSTSYRNHPLELAVTWPASALVVLAVGSPPSVVIVTQTIASVLAIWQHADIAIPRRIDSALSWLIVTPRLHRLHHNPDRATHDSNYGEVFTAWDRMFGTFTDRHTRERVGLDDQIAAPDRLLEQIWSPLHAA